MFLFIRNIQQLHPGNQDFNTSHVLIYRNANKRNSGRKRISIHLMFLFITITYLHQSVRKPFQYISCSYLSSTITMLKIYYPHFNTSHVLIYHRKGRICCLQIKISIHLMFLFIPFELASRLSGEKFQYISCSYLSKRLSNLFAISSHFNTSHVLIYRNNSSRKYHWQIHFNTSHVLIYLFPFFIFSHYDNIFQYISCSYLSVFGKKYRH